MKRNTKLVSIALVVLMLCAVMAVPSMALQISVNGPADTDPNPVTLTKNLIVDVTATIPTEAFTFVLITGAAVDGTDADDPLVATSSGATKGPVLEGILPTGATSITAISGTFGPTDSTTVGSATDQVTTNTNEKYASKNVKFDLSGIEYTTPGIYRYTLYEQPGSTPGVTYDTNAYTLDVVVGYLNPAAEGTGTMSILGTFYYAANNNGSLTDYTDDYPEGPKLNDSMVSFPPINNSMASSDLEIKKDVTGTLGDNEKYFEFKVRADASTAGYKYRFQLYEGSTLLDGTITAHQSIIANILDGSGLAMTTTASIMNASQEYTIHLRDNTSIKIFEVQVGEQVTAKEEKVQAQGYLATVSTGSLTDEAKNDGTLSDGANITGKMTTADSTVTFTNTKNATALTGVIIQVLPFILIVIIAGAGLAALAISKRRKSHTSR